jgi:predicted ATPase
MIQKIEIKNFKSLKDISINTKALNLLAGLNGMGKSSFIQTLLLLKQSDEIANGKIRLKGRLIDVGKGKDVLYQFASAETINFSFLFSDNDKLKWSFFYKPEWEFLESNDSYPVDTVHRLLNGFQYLSADRVGPLVMYDTSLPSVTKGDLGVKGEYAVHFLHENGGSCKISKQLKHYDTSDLTLINQVNGWLSEISPGIKLNVVEVPGVDKMLLNYQYEIGVGRTAYFKPINVGYGISYVLSIIISLLVCKKDDIIIIENPEAHIHPRGQAELGKLMALSAASGSQLFVETHSDHIINGVRVAVKEGLVGKDDVNLSYFTKKTSEDEQYSEITEIRIDERGELSDYPKDFLDEWNNQLLKLV